MSESDFVGLSILVWLVVSSATLALCYLAGLVVEQCREIGRLRHMIDGMAARIVSQSDQLSRVAEKKSEKPDPPSHPLLGPWVLVSLLLLAGSSRAEPWDAVVRIPSHGASATVIFTEPGRTLLLGCGHAYADPGSKTKPHVIDAPAPKSGATRTGGIRLIRHSFSRDTDLSLLEMGYGPLPYVAPVAPAGHRANQLISAGYDEMKVIAGVRPTVRPATILTTNSGWTYTRERPWHGRSGGALLDRDTGHLIGVVSGYTGPQTRQETYPGAHGVFVSHAAVLRFLGLSRRTEEDSRLSPQNWMQPPGVCPPEGCPDEFGPQPAPGINGFR